MASLPAPASVALALAGATPSPGGRVATANLPPLGGLTDSATAPSGLMAHALNVLEDFDSDDNFCWDGDETGADSVAIHINLTTPLPFTPCAVQLQYILSHK